MTFLWFFGVTLAALLAGAGVLHLLPKLGATGRRISANFCQAPGLDLVIGYFIVLPIIFGPVFGGWKGLAGAIAGQVLTVLIWSRLHELAHREAARGPRIVKTLNRLHGRWRNHAGLWITSVVAPGFCIVRLAEYISYIPLTWIIGLPAYRQSEWVNVSRQKFDGLIGHDLIWCLYCDWMTGIWSLGTEMLRNVESYWCPIKFYNGKKCENCTIDFPDIDNGWVEADSDMATVTRKLETMYSNGDRSWFGHPVRLTVNKKPIEPVIADAPV
jgi:hypothetical protein